MSIPLFAPAAQSLQSNTRQITATSEHLSELRPVVLLPATLAGIFVHRRHGVPVELADTVALLAGLGTEEAQH